MNLYRLIQSFLRKEDAQQRLFANARALRLSQQERQEVRQTILATMRATPAPKTSRPPLSSWFSIFIRQPVPVALSMALVFAVGSGAVYGAERALPGDALYPIKIHVTEPLRTITKRTLKAKAQWETQKAQRRLEEAETLAARGTLSAQVATTLNAQFVHHTDQAEQMITRLSENTQGESNDPAEAHELESAMQATLNAHVKIIAAIEHQQAEASPTTPPTPQEPGNGLKLLAAAVEEHAQSMRNDQREHGHDREQQHIQQRLHRSENAIAAARSTVEQSKDAIEGHALAAAQQQLMNAQEHINEGRKKIEEGSAEEGVKLIDEGHQSAVELKTLVEEQERLSHELTNPVNIIASTDENNEQHKQPESSSAPMPSSQPNLEAPTLLSPASASIELSVTSDKRHYQAQEPIRIVITAHNTGSMVATLAPKTSSDCLIAYRIDGRAETLETCPPPLSVSIEPGVFISWNIIIPAATLAPGTHAITGMLEESGEAQTTITINEEPTPRREHSRDQRSATDTLPLDNKKTLNIHADN